MRLVFFILVLGNLVFYVWSAGYLGGQSGGHEPERLNQEISAEKIRIVPDLPPTPAKTEETPLIECRSLNGLSVEDAGSLENLLKNSEGVTVKLNTTPGITAHWVLMPNIPTRAFAEKKLSELSQLGVEDAKIVNDAVSGPLVVSLGIFSTEAAAQNYLATLGKKGVRSAKVESRERSAPTANLEVRAAVEFLGHLPETLTPYAGATIGVCPAATEPQ